MSTTATAHDHHKLWELIKGIRFGMLTHRHANGMLHSQPLTTLNKSADEGDKLYFFISRNSDVAQQILHDSHVNVAYTNPNDDTYVSVSGNAEIVEDPLKKEALWSAMVKAWFPDGPKDPHLALLQVRISHAEYWDVGESKMMQVTKMVTAAVMGTPPVHMGEHKKLHLP